MEYATDRTIDGLHVIDQNINDGSIFRNKFDMWNLIKKFKVPPLVSQM